MHMPRFQRSPREHFIGAAVVVGGCATYDVRHGSAERVRSELPSAHGSTFERSSQSRERRAAGGRKHAAQ